MKFYLNYQQQRALITIKGQQIKLTETILILIWFNEAGIQDFNKMRKAKNI